MEPKWFGPHLASTMAKYGMSMCVIGHAEEFGPHGIAVDALWPRTPIATAALAMIPGVKAEHGRSPQIVADSAALIFASAGQTGHCYIDDEVLAAHGITDLGRYAMMSGTDDLQLDLFL